LLIGRRWEQQPYPAPPAASGPRRRAAPSWPEQSQSPPDPGGSEKTHCLLDILPTIVLLSQYRVMFS
jgi:hypothetical protein